MAWQSYEHVKNGKQQVASSQQLVASSQQQVSSSKQQVASTKQQVASSQQLVARSQQLVASSQQLVASFHLATCNLQVTGSSTQELQFKLCHRQQMHYQDQQEDHFKETSRALKWICNMTLYCIKSSSNTLFLWMKRLKLRFLKCLHCYL